MAYDPFLSTEQLAGLRTLLGRGLTTVQEFQSPSDPIQIRRFNKTEAKYEDYGYPIEPISIKFGLDDRTEKMIGVPITTDATVGRMKMWEDDADVIVGDRFSWQGYVLEVVRVFPVRFETIIAQVEMKQK